MNLGFRHHPKEYFLTTFGCLLHNSEVGALSTIIQLRTCFSTLPCLHPACNENLQVPSCGRLCYAC